MSFSILGLDSYGRLMSRLRHKKETLIHLLAHFDSTLASSRHFGR